MNSIILSQIDISFKPIKHIIPKFSLMAKIEDDSSNKKIIFEKVNPDVVKTILKPEDQTVSPLIDKFNKDFEDLMEIGHEKDILFETLRIEKVLKKMAEDFINVLTFEENESKKSLDSLKKEIKEISDKINPDSLLNVHVNAKPDNFKVLSSLLSIKALKIKLLSKIKYCMIMLSDKSIIELEKYESLKTLYSQINPSDITIKILLDPNGMNL